MNRSTFSPNTFPGRAMRDPNRGRVQPQSAATRSFPLPSLLSHHGVTKLDECKKRTECKPQEQYRNQVHSKPLLFSSAACRFFRAILFFWPLPPPAHEQNRTGSPLSLPLLEQAFSPEKTCQSGKKIDQCLPIPRHADRHDRPAEMDRRANPARIQRHENEKRSLLRRKSTHWST